MNERHGYEQLGNGALASCYCKWAMLGATDAVLSHRPASLSLQAKKKHF
jgi:hypothetical protein